MPTWSERIHNAQGHLAVLRRERDLLAEQVAQWEARAAEQQGAIQHLNARVVELEQRNEVLRKTQERREVFERAGTKERIDELVGEIDRCLELLKA